MVIKVEPHGPPGIPKPSPGHNEDVEEIIYGKKIGSEKRTYQHLTECVTAPIEPGEVGAVGMTCLSTRSGADRRHEPPQEMNYRVSGEPWWQRLEPLLPKPKRRRFRFPGRKPLPPRRILTGILFILKTGISWDDLPPEMGCGCGRTCRNYLQRWYRKGVWKRLQLVLLTELDEALLINWERAAVDSGSSKAPCGGRDTGPNPTDRRKLGTKHHVLVDANGIPLAATTSKANRHDGKVLIPLLNALLVIRTRRGQKHHYPKRLYGDRAYDDNKLRKACRELGILPFLAKRLTGHGSHLGKVRWVVERTISWLHQFRRLGYRRDRSLTFHRAFLLSALCVIYLRVLLS